MKYTLVCDSIAVYLFTSKGLIESTSLARIVFLKYKELDEKIKKIVPEPAYIRDTGTKEQKEILKLTVLIEKL